MVPFGRTLRALGCTLALALSASCLATDTIPSVAPSDSPRAATSSPQLSTLLTPVGPSSTNPPSPSLGLTPEGSPAPTLTAGPTPAPATASPLPTDTAPPTAPPAATPRATPTATAAVPTSTPTPTPTTPIPTDGGEPTGFEHFHTYAEIDALLDDIAQRHSGIARRISLGTSHEGRRIFAVKISDNAGADEHEPEVFINGGMHARERSSMEMSIYIIEMLTSGYGRDPEITAIVDSTEIFVAPLMNPDGAEFDISGGRFHRWRKNRQPIPGSAEIGVDLNRQFDFMWGCCGGSSDNPRKEHYRGPDPWFAPEVRAYRDFVNSRVVNGQQQITTIISWHSAGRLVLWPYYFTKTDIPPQMRVDDHATFVALGQRAARLNGYRAQQGSDLYIADGDQDDWAYHEHRIFAFTIEMAKGNGRYYPTAAELNADMAANRAAALLLLDFADCPYRAANLEATYCA